VNTHRVLKALPMGNGEPLKPGTEVDASEWRTLPLLVKQRYLQPLDGVADTYGRQHVSSELEDELFEARVVAVIKKHVSANGELAQMLSQSEEKISVRKSRREGQA
jgi:hypothetical protein